jgi:alpha-tubulin suppressor-like RCC1 family protein
VTHRLRRPLGGALLVAAVGAFNGCQDPTQATAILRTNVPYGPGTNVALWATRSGRLAEPAGTWAEPWLADGNIGDLVVVPEADQRSSPLTLRVALGLRGRAATDCSDTQPSNCIVARRKLAFLPHTRLRIPIVMYLACEGVVCDPDSTCNAFGACVPATVDPNACATPEGCTLPGDPPFDPTPTVRDAGVDAEADAPGLIDAPFDVAPAPVVVSNIAPGTFTTCARLSDGKVKCWGNGTFGHFASGAALQGIAGDAPGEMGDALVPRPLPNGRTATQISVASSAGACAVLDSGDVFCQGVNASGWLGRGSGQSELVDLGTGLKATQVVLLPFAGRACARITDGRVKCWGAGGGSGDLVTRGDDPGEMGDALPFVDLGAGFDVAELAGGGSFLCARAVDGRVKCWGFNGNGQLGLGDTIFRGSAPGEMGNALPVVNLGTGLTAKSVGAGDSHVCAVLSNDALKCWGTNNSGQLGIGDSLDRGGAPGEMGDGLPPVDLGPGAVPTSVVLSPRHTCARLQSGAVKCWGAGGELGAGDALARGSLPAHMGNNLPVVDLGPGETTASLSAGPGYATCALLTAGGLKCWGVNGSLGVGDAASRGDAPNQMGVNLPRIDLGLGANVTRVAIGFDTSCALLGTGQIKCWGSVMSPAACRGDRPGTMGAALPAIALGTGLDALEVVTSQSAACALIAGGKVKCWGSSSSAALGLGDTLGRGSVPGDMGDNLPFVSLGAAAVAVQLAMTSQSVCARLSDGSIKCWGGNAGQLGLGDSAPRGFSPGQMADNLPPVALGPGLTATQVVAGSSHYCALLSNGAVKCWGDNASGQLGVGDTNNRGDDPGEMGANLPAVSLGTTAPVKSIAAGASHNCALFTDGRLKCWGSNNAGELGLGNVLPAPLGDTLPFVDLGTGAVVQSLAAGGAVTCALLLSGQVKCWGGGAQGALGLGDTLNRGGVPGQMGDALPAVQLGTGWTTAQLSCGLLSCCSISTQGRAKCWGRNDRGGLGLGDSLRRGAVPGTMGDVLPALELP